MEFQGGIQHCYCLTYCYLRAVFFIYLSKLTFYPLSPGHHQLDILARIGRVVIRRSPLGTPDRRDSVQGAQRADGRVRRCQEHAAAAHPEHVPRAVAAPHGR